MCFCIVSLLARRTLAYFACVKSLARNTILADPNPWGRDMHATSKLDVGDIFITTYQTQAFFYLFLILINPVQFPLHEPYFDLTPIKVTHTKIIC